MKRALFIGMFSAFFLMGCGGGGERVSVDDASPKSVAPIQTGPQQDLARAAVQDYFREEDLPTAPITLPGKYTPPPQDGWVADWGLWSVMTENEAKKFYIDLPKELALKYTFGKPTKELVIFTDPYNQDDRRFYRLMDNKTEDMNAVVYVFPLPGRLEVGNIERILCTPDPEKSWWSWMMMIAPSRLDAMSLETPRLDPQEETRLWGVWKEQNPQMLSCENKERAAQIAKLATDVGVSHTPTVLFANGRAWPSPRIEWDDVEKNWSYVYGRLGIKFPAE